LKLKEGSLVADRFAIVRFIAEGGMGEVYEAEDRVLGENVALKFLSHRSIGDDQMAKRFKREIQLARKVTHPNVCRLHDVYFHEVQVPGLPREKSKVAFVTMELLEGETLEALIQRRGRLTEDEALPIVIQICHALDAAHSAGIIHRDLKCNNVMLVRDKRISFADRSETGSGAGIHRPPSGAGLIYGDRRASGEAPEDRIAELRVVVTDFGLARSTTASGDPTSSSRTPLTVDELIVGTADYMAPEQIHGEKVSLQSDLYALGVVIFEMVTGRKPYSAPNAMQLLVKRVSEAPARPRDFTPELSHLWESVILRCLADKPEDRPASAREVLRELEGTAVLPIGLVAQARAATTPRPTGSGLHSKAATTTTVIVEVPARAWSLPALGLAVLAVLGLATALLFQQGRPKDDQRAFRPQRLTTGAGLESEPSLSPDGKSVVYSGELADGSFELFVQPLKGNEPARQLTLADGQAFEPAWSPDGARIVYHSRAQGGLWLTTPQGGRPQRLTATGSRPEFSPDGKTIVYQSESAPLISDNTTPAIVPSHLWLLDLESRQSRPLTHPSQPAGGHGSPVFTPDGRFVVFSSSYRGVSEIWSVAVEDGVVRRLVNEPRASFDPAVSPDGRRVYFSALANEVKDLWEIEVDPEDLKPLGQPREVAGLGVSSVRQPAFAAKGGGMVFSAYSTHSNLWRLEIDPVTREAVGAAKPLTYGDDRYSRPAFSPDGKFLAFDHWKTGIEIDVWTLELASGKRQHLGVGQGRTSQASWTPDQRVAFSTWDRESRSLDRYDPQTQARTPWKPLPLDADWASVAPNGRWLAYHTRGNGSTPNVWLMDLEGTSTEQITFHENLAGFPVWSRDSRWLAYQVRQGESSQLWLLELATRTTRQLTFSTGNSWPYSFSPDNQGIAFAGLRNGIWNLYWIDRATLETHELTHATTLTSYPRYPTWAPDGRSILFELSESRSDLFVVAGFE
jgi:Tol biopolymer transport system component/serine/threonine protein kinase